jgi:hypothetical protein
MLRAQLELGAGRLGTGDLYNTAVDDDVSAMGTQWQAPFKRHVAVQGRPGDASKAAPMAQGPRRRAIDSTMGASPR